MCDVMRGARAIFDRHRYMARYRHREASPGVRLHTGLERNFMGRPFVEERSDRPLRRLDASFDQHDFFRLKR